MLVRKITHANLNIYKVYTYIYIQGMRARPIFKAVHPQAHPLRRAETFAPEAQASVSICLECSWLKP